VNLIFKVYRLFPVKDLLVFLSKEVDSNSLAKLEAKAREQRQNPKELYSTDIFFTEKSICFILGLYFKHLDEALNSFVPETGV